MIFIQQSKKIALAAILLFSHIFIYAGADLIIFSFDRPLQLYALLESIDTYMTGVDEIKIVYRASNDAFEAGYQQVKHSYPEARFFRQGSSPSLDFKPLTLAATFESSSHYVMFAVDDIIVKDFINLDDAIDLLESNNAYGVYLRLGLHLTECYPNKCLQPLPRVDHVVEDVYQWIFAHGNNDWRYPFTVDMTLYRKKDIEAYFRTIDYSNPNTLEGNWSCYMRNVIMRHGLCYELSKMVNIPVNLVNTTTNNPHMNAYTPQELLDLFNAGFKIDIKPLFQIPNKAAHIEYDFRFIER